MVKLAFTFLVALMVSCTAAHADAPAAAKRIAIAVTKKGFEPDNIKVPAGQPIALVFTRTTEQTCTKKVVVMVDEATKIQRDLPLDQPVEIAVTFPKPGKLSYAC